MWSRGWTSLHPIQEQAAAPILEGQRDVILAAPTAAGKTEAAFLPIVSHLARAGGLCVCVSPLKALINDQFRRLEGLGESADVRVTRWHGDVSRANKKRFLESPVGVLLITPESLEAQLVRRGPVVAGVVAGISHLVVDEFHAFIGSDRGKQLQSLMHRVDLLSGRRVPRIALSATLGDMSIAARYLRPTDAESVVVVQDESARQTIQLMLRGYVIKDPNNGLKPTHHNKSEAADRVAREIASRLFRTMRGSDNLIFANSRENVERYADLLRLSCEEARVPVEFFPHHGSLAKDLRQHAEAELKSDARPASVVATSTLEMGIDVGTVESIAQIGVPPSVASLRQRVGRSGRKGGSAVLRFHVPEAELDSGSRAPDRLRAQTVQSIAMVQLMLAGWVEPPDGESLNLSTLVQQLLSHVAQRGAVNAGEAWRLLCASGLFILQDQKVFARLLRRLGALGLLTQTSDGLLTLGEAGERLVDHYTFYAAFSTPRELQVIHAGKVLGTLPVRQAIVEGSAVIFGGRRWVVLKVDRETHAITVSPSKGARPPTFFGSGPMVHEVVRRRMREVYLSPDVPRFVDARATELLTEGRTFFREAQLSRELVIRDDSSSTWLTWAGDKAVNTLCVLLGQRGIEAFHGGVCIDVDVSPDQLLRVVQDLLMSAPPSPVALARPIRFKEIGKYDRFLTSELLCENFAAARFDIPGAWRELRALATMYG